MGNGTQMSQCLQALPREPSGESGQGLEGSRSPSFPLLLTVTRREGKRWGRSSQGRVPKGKATVRAGPRDSPSSRRRCPGSHDAHVPSVERCYMGGARAIPQLCPDMWARRHGKQHPRCHITPARRETRWLPSGQATGKIIDGKHNTGVASWEPEAIVPTKTPGSTPTGSMFYATMFMSIGSPYPPTLPWVSQPPPPAETLAKTPAVPGGIPSHVQGCTRGLIHLQGLKRGHA